jgi:hypothetical protein
MERDGLGWSWAPDGTQAVGGEDALRALPAEAAPPDAAARRPGDVVIPAVPLVDDPRLAADAITRWMDDDRARRESTPPTPPTPSTPSTPPREGAPRATAAPHRPPVPQFTAAPSAPPVAQPTPPPRPTEAPSSAAAPQGPSAVGWVPVVALLVMLLVIAMVVVLGAG